MTQIFWVRHGPTHEKAFTGHRDVPVDLSDTALIARVCAALPAAALVTSSDLQRAHQTALALAGNRPMLAPSAALREFDFGQWDGMDFDAVARRDPSLSRRFWEEPGDLAPPGGESWNAVAARVGAVVDHWTRTHPGQDIIAVAHMGVIMTQIARAGGLTPYQAMGHQIGNLSITDMRFAKGRWQLGRVNHIP